MADRYVKDFSSTGAVTTKKVKSTDILATEVKDDADLQAALERQRKAREEDAKPKVGLGGLAAAAAARRKREAMPESLEKLRR